MNDLKLTKLSKSRISESEMKHLKGGDIIVRACGCSCWAKDLRGSSVNANFGANYDGGENGLVSDRGEIQKAQHTVVITKNKE